LHQDGEAGFAEGLELLAGLLQRYGMQLHPQRERSRKAALEWLAGPCLDSLSLFPEVIREDAQRTAGALLLISTRLETEPEASRPELNALYSALESRLMKAGGVDAVVPQNAGIRRSHSPYACDGVRCAGSEPHHLRSGFAGPGPYPDGISA
jgi:type VI secretion system protein VasJ